MLDGYTLRMCVRRSLCVCMRAGVMYGCSYAGVSSTLRGLMVALTLGVIERGPVLLNFHPRVSSVVVNWLWFTAEGNGAPPTVGGGSRCRVSAGSA
jgi:hypothetical protein